MCNFPVFELCKCAYCGKYFCHDFTKECLCTKCQKEIENDTEYFVVINNNKNNEYQN